MAKKMKEEVVEVKQARRIYFQDVNVPSIISEAGMWVEINPTNQRRVKLWLTKNGLKLGEMKQPFKRPDVVYDEKGKSKDNGLIDSTTRFWYEIIAKPAEEANSIEEEANAEG